MSRKLSRRGLLKGAAAAGAVACTRPAAPGTGGGAGDDSAPPATGSIEHVIMVMMENRSFDHWYGARALLEGRSEEDGLTAEMSNPAPDGTLIPVFHATELCVPDPPHSWSGSHNQFDKGACDGFAQAQAASHGGDGADVLGYLTREELPVSYALADAYTQCDRYFASLMTSTWPNRFYGHCGSSQGMPGNDLPDGGAFTDPSIWAKLDEIGVDWGYYYTDLNYQSLLYSQIDVSRGKLIEELFRALEDGELPPVVWIDPGFSYNDNHPPHHPAMGELFLAALHESLATSPLWDKVLVVVTYDEHGGFFDHVPPPLVPDDRAADGFDQLGFRVPTVILGPWVRQGVDHTQYDHTSWLRYLCDKYGIEPWNARIAAADPLSGAIDTDAMARNEPRAAVELPAFSFDESLLGPECTDLLPRDLQSLGRLHDRPRLARLFHDVWRKRGLIG